MADADGTDFDPGGQLVLEDRVGECVARVAALSVPGVERRRGALGVITRGGRPKALAKMTPRRPEVYLDIAVRWPAAAFAAAEDVQSRVADEFARVVGVTPRRVDVAVGEILPALPTRVDTEYESPSTDASSSDASSSEPQPERRRDRRVRAVPGSALSSAVLAIGLIALAAIAVHDLVVGRHGSDGPQWFAAASRWIGRLEWHQWMLPAAIGLVVVGVLLLWLSVAPRRVTHIAFDGQTSRSATYLHRGAIAGHAGAVARDIDGVDAARATAGRRKVSVRLVLHPDVDEQDVKHELQQRLSGELARLTGSRRLVVTVDRPAGS